MTREPARMDCAQARGLIVESADDALAREDFAWLDRHCQECDACLRLRARFPAVDRQLLAVGGDWIGAAPALEVRPRVAPPDGAGATRPDRARWLPTAALIAAAFLLAMVLPRHGAIEQTSEDAGFVNIPFVPPLDPNERATLVSMPIRVATLQAEGYKIGGDPAALVSAMVLIGEDGRAHAVRLLSNIPFKGMGD